MLPCYIHRELVSAMMQGLSDGAKLEDLSLSGVLVNVDTSRF